MERSWKNLVELTVTTVMGTSFKVRMSPEETILDIKRRIHYREGIAVDKQHLIWKSVELEDKVKIKDYKMTSGTTLQLVTAMRGGPLNIRRVPMRDESQWMRLQFADGELEDGVPRGRPVAVIVLQDGTELHFFQFVDSDHSLDIDDSSDEESEIRSTDAAEVRERKESNARTRAAMASLRARMEQTSTNKKAKAAARLRPPTKSPVGKTTKPTINGGSGTKLPAANIPIVVGRPAINTTRSSTLQNSDEKKAKRSDVSVNSSKRNVEHQNRNDQVNSSSFIAHQASSSSIWAKLLLSTSKLSTSKLSGLERSDASLRTADNPNIAADNRTTSAAEESSMSSIWLRRVQARGEVSRTNSGRLIAQDSNYSTHSSTVVKGRANKNTAASGVIGRHSPTTTTSHCSYCSRKLRLTGNFQCRCGGTFCGLHRYPESHRCPYDYKTKGRQVLEKDNPRVVAEKFRKI